MPVEIEADERLLRHVFTNLLTNAVKYSDAGRLVRFKIESAGTDTRCEKPRPYCGLGLMERKV